MFWNIPLWLTAIQFFVVTSGSMSPVISTGSLVATQPQQSPYQIGQIIAFKSSRGVITHRIADRRQLDDHWYYVTRGDANPTVDPDWVTTGDILGSVKWHLPYVGYAVQLLRNPISFVLFILLPATVLILQELRVIKQSWRELRSLRVLLAISLLGLMASVGLSAKLAQAWPTSNAIIISHNTFQVGSTNSSNNP